MKFVFIVSGAALMMVSCSNEQETQQEQQIPEVKYFQPTQELAQACLERDLSFVEAKPNSLKDFVMKIGNASVTCNASDADVTAYAQAIHTKFGGRL